MSINNQRIVRIIDLDAIDAPKNTIERDVYIGFREYPYIPLVTASVDFVFPKDILAPICPINPTNTKNSPRKDQKDDKIIGFVLLDDISNAGVYLSLFTRRVNVSKFKDKLLSKYFYPGFLLTQLL